MTSSPDLVRGQPTSEPTPPPATDPPLPPHVLPHPLLRALYTIFSEGSPEAAQLTPLFAPTAVWDTPLLTLGSAKEAVDFFASLFFFAEDPTLDVHSATSDDATLRFDWALSFTYPLPWRPRVSVSGTSRAAFSDGLITRIDDEWYMPPTAVLAQALPTLTDIIWLWPTPHPENDAGRRRVLRNARRYTLVRHAPHREVRARDTLMPGDRDRIWAVPVLPDCVFEGGLRRKEQYSTVTPIGLRKVGEDEFEWAVAVPGTLVGSSPVKVKEPEAENAWVEDVGVRVWATHRFRGFASREVVDKKLNEVVGGLVDDGVIESPADLKLGTVWVRSYDARAGFNSKGMLSMATYGTTYGLPRLNELAIDLTDVVGVADE